MSIFVLLLIHAADSEITHRQRVFRLIFQSTLKILFCLFVILFFEVKYSYIIVSIVESWIDLNDLMIIFKSLLGKAKTNIYVSKSLIGCVMLRIIFNTLFVVLYGLCIHVFLPVNVC